jgi:CO/xanthine dehydrogenase FAD-binding subunit
MREIEAGLRGASVESACAHIAQSEALLRDRLAPVSDIHGSEEYKIYMTKVLLQRALRESAGGQHE